jgi:hypothetical protein
MPQGGTLEKPDYPRASSRRLVLAVYLDYLLFGVAWTVALWTLAQFAPSSPEGPFWLKLLIFAVGEFLLLRTIHWSPGHALLSIEPRSDRAQGVANVFVVNPTVLQRERWWTVLLGVLLILDGAKVMVRWIDFSPPLPLFGVALSAGVAVGLALLIGLGQIGVGVGILQHRIALITFGLFLYGFQILSAVFSWPRLPDWAARVVEARRAFQGLDVRDGEVELAQSVLPVIAVGVPLLVILWLWAIAARIQRPAAA